MKKVVLLFCAFVMAFSLNAQLETQSEESIAKYETSFPKVVEETKVREIVVQTKLSETVSDRAVPSLDQEFPMVKKEDIPEQTTKITDIVENMASDQAQVKVNSNLASVNEQVSDLGATENIKSTTDLPRKATRSRENSITCIDHHRPVIDQTKPLDENQLEPQESSHSRELSLPRLQEEVVKSDTVMSISNRDKPKSSKVKSARQLSQTREQEHVTKVESTKTLAPSSETRGRARLKETSSKLNKSKDLESPVRSLSLAKNESSSTREERCEDLAVDLLNI